VRTKCQGRYSERHERPYEGVAKVGSRTERLGQEPIRKHEEVCSPSENPRQMALSSGGESAPLIRVRSVVRVHEGPPKIVGAAPSRCRQSFSPSSLRVRGLTD
jgi:hypothetical protein